VPERLAAVYRDSASSVYREAMHTRVGQADLERALGAWPLLARLAGSGHKWATELADQHWPSGIQDQQRIISVDSDWVHSTWLRNRIYELIPLLSPMAAGKLIWSALAKHGGPVNGVEDFYPSPDWYRQVVALTRSPTPSS
jgi:hypothetical protein